jgi:hypothetical protein
MKIFARNGLQLNRRIRFMALRVALAGATALGQRIPTNTPPQYGPYNAVFLEGGDGLRIPLANKTDTVLLPDTAWTLSCWYNSGLPANGRELLAGVGDVTAEYPRYLALEPGKVSLWLGAGNELSGQEAALEPGAARPGWHLVTATFDGSEFALYSDGHAVAKGTLTLGTATPVLQIAPPVMVAAQTQHFSGKVASFQLLRRALTAAEVRVMDQTPPDFAVLEFDEGSKPWAVQTRAWGGYRAPQSPEQMPVGRGPYSQPVALKRPPMGESLQATGAAQTWSFADGWTLREAPKVQATGEQITVPGFEGADWMRATVPGTVLTTMIDDGIYADPDYGLNNLTIPEMLNKQSYWYRNVFSVPSGMETALHAPGAHVEMTFQGINYEAEVWLNGTHLGTMKGAFKRGNFDVTAVLRPGEKNVLAVRITPPPHPGIPQEQSIAGGPGENGGAMELDGPTFLATEGWDWVPAIRDRDSGIWQPVILTVSHQLTIGDAQVVTTFQHHDLTKAAVEVSIPVRNLSDKSVDAVVEATIESVRVSKRVTVAPGAGEIKLLPADFPQLTLQHPRLWWPNGYGKPELYTLALQLRVGDAVSDARKLRFGVREVSYELSLLDPQGKLRRVELTPADARGAAQPIVDVSHDGMREIPGADAIALNVPEEQRDQYQYRSVVSSLSVSGATSPAIRTIAGGGSAPYLVIVINGVKIAARGGNWGMDDSRKRVSREHLEPFFRLNRDANLNIIRNWVGQNTEETFYELADEYGMMVWNDFWESTQNYNLEAEDPVLFLANARDTIEHFRNHPSIMMWCGRNEGVPQPIINQGLDSLVRTLDGTRFYSPSSNQINLQQSGPYSYQDPSLYYTRLNRGFSVETGTPSMSTLESFESSTPRQDQWPFDDVWAYHDWHSSGNGNTAPFMAELEAEFGAATSLADFERKAQMMNYVDHRAIFEGMNANLWAPNSGRLLWMTQPAWPSTMWQILSSDYDTQASFYGSKKACEPVHVQLNLATGQVDVVNTTIEPKLGLRMTAKVYSLSNKLLVEQTEQKDVEADAVAHGTTLNLARLLHDGMVLVELTLADGAGAALSRNLYWRGEKSASYRELQTLPAAAMTMTAEARNDGAETVLTVHVSNRGTSASLANKLILLGSDKMRILPAYYTDNYVSLLPGESQMIEIRFPEQAGLKRAEIALRGWNAFPQSISVMLGR